MSTDSAQADYLSVAFFRRDRPDRNDVVGLHGSGLYFGYRVAATITIAPGPDGRYRAALTFAYRYPPEIMPGDYATAEQCARACARYLARLYPV